MWPRQPRKGDVLGGGGGRGYWCGPLEVNTKPDFCCCFFFFLVGGGGGGGWSGSSLKKVSTRAEQLDDPTLRS